VMMKRALYHPSVLRSGTIYLGGKRLPKLLGQGRGIRGGRGALGKGEQTMNRHRGARGGRGRGGRRDTRKAGGSSAKAKEAR
jgi:hypothetical protein